MPSLALFGATGNLGRHVAGVALARGFALSVAVRNPSRLEADVASRARVIDLDLASASIADVAASVAGHDSVVFCAGTVAEGAAFVALVDKAVTALESLAVEQRPVCWFLAGAALLPLDETGRLGVELPKVRDMYWPHRENHQRLLRSGLDWRLLCPGPMVEQPSIGPERLRVSVDALPTPLPRAARLLPGPLVLPLFAMKIPEMIVPYADAAAFMLANVTPGDWTSRHRLGLALPAGMKGSKKAWGSA
ncbi:MAG: NAD(P)-dependent oxidoreductase [Gammaproteobacteria bacterium]